MERVYVVTHPEATHHVEGRVGGWFDSELTARGIREAEQIAAHLKGVIPDGVVPQLVSSDLRRTLQTAELIGAAFGVQPALELGLREKSYGAAEGKPQRWLDERFVFPPVAGDRMNHDEGIEGGETKREWVARAYESMARIQREPADTRIIVTHGGTANWVIAAWMRIPQTACAYVNFRAPSGSVTVLEQDDRFNNRALTVLGDRSFIAADSLSSAQG